MSLWKRPISLEAIIQRSEDTFAAHCGIEWIDYDATSLSAKMEVTASIKQPVGIMHGGASCVLAETVGSTGANFALDLTHYAVGLEINTNHIRAIKEGFVFAKATALHVGRQTQVWQIPITDEKGRLISMNRLTMMNLKK